MFIYDNNINVESTDSLLDKLIPPYHVSALVSERAFPYPELDMIRFPSFTAQTWGRGVIMISTQSHQIGEREIEFPEFRKVGRVKLKIRDVSRMTPPDFSYI